MTLEVAYSHYSRSDHAALRAYCMKLPISVIERHYFSEDDFPNEKFNTVEQYLLEMLREIIDRAIVANPHFANTLNDTLSGSSISDKALNILIETANLPKIPPSGSQGVAKWFRKNTARALLNEDITTLNDLIFFINQKGRSWWRGIPRIGKLRARIIVMWLHKNAQSIGTIHQFCLDDYDINGKSESEHTHQKRNLSISKHVTALEFISVNADLDGHLGFNRCHHFCYVQANSDIEAIECYLSRHIDIPSTFRSYRKEIERLLLWSLLVANKPLSSLTIDDCIAYTAFLDTPTLEFVGAKHPRNSHLWRPFASHLSRQSQERSIKLIKNLFNWLVAVRYLQANPFLALTKKNKDSIHKTNEINTDNPKKLASEIALSQAQWNHFVDVLTMESQSIKGHQLRILLAATLLMGDSGLLLSEVVRLKISDIKNKVPMKHFVSVFNHHGELRQVPISARTMSAICAHWLDRGIENDVNLSDPSSCLLCPIVTPNGILSNHVHSIDPTGGYTSDGLYRLLKRSVSQLISKHKFNGDCSIKFKTMTPFTLRHTFCTLGFANGMPMSIIQGWTGIKDAKALLAYLPKSNGDTSSVDEFSYFK